MSQQPLSPLMLELMKREAASGGGLGGYGGLFSGGEPMQTMDMVQDPSTGEMVSRHELGRRQGWLGGGGATTMPLDELQMKPGALEMYGNAGQMDGTIGGAGATGAMGARRAARGGYGAGMGAPRAIPGRATGRIRY